MSSCAVSVLVPAYNVEKYLRQCLDSLVNQTLEDLQIICINDGSKDSTLAILEEYARNDERIEIITKENTGYGHSMNLGLAKARGEYVGLVEPDDFADVHMFEKLYHAAVEHDADVVKSNYYAHETDRNPDDDELIENLEHCRYGTVFKPREQCQVMIMQPAIWSAIYKRSFLEENNICFLETPGASFQDTGFNFKVLAAAERAYLLKEGFLHYRIDNAASSVKSMSKVFCICDEYDEIWKFARSHPHIFDVLKFRIPFIQFGGYAWNLDRLSPELQHGFYERLIEDFSQLQAEGLLDASGFNKPSWEKLSGMLADPEGYFRRVYGPSKVETSYVVWSASKGAARQVLGAVAAFAGSNDEIIAASFEMDAIVEDLRGQDSRIFPSTDLFDSRLLGSILRNRIRGERLVAVFGEDASSIAGLLRDASADAGSSRDARASKGACAVSISTADDLFSNDVPVMLPLLIEGVYSGAKSEPAAALEPIEWHPDESLEVANSADYERSVHALLRVMNWCEQVHEDIAAWEGLLPCFAHVWRALQDQYDQLPFEVQEKVEKPSSKLLPQVEVAAYRAEQAPDVTVVIPVYNVEKYLSQCLDSVLGQRDVSLQVVCVDDGSSDGSLDILRGYAERDSRVQVLTQLNGGAAAARNRGISCARGEYLAFIDPDDFYPSEHSLAHLVQAGRDNNALMVGGSFSTVDPSGFVCEDLREEEPFYLFRKEGWRELEDVPTDYGWIRFVYKRSLFDQGLCFPELAWYEDPVFFVRALALARRIYAIPEVVYRYRVDYKSVDWTAAKARDLLRGISLNLDAAVSLGSGALYNLMIRRVDLDYCDQIVRNLDDEATLVQLARIQGKIDNSHADPSRGYGKYHVLVPLAIMQGSGTVGRGTAVVRLARKVERSGAYRGLQAAIRRARRQS